MPAIETAPVHANDMIDGLGISATRLKAKANKLQTDRTTLESDWRTIAKFMGDPRDDFTRYEATNKAGMKKRQRSLGRYDDTGEDALDNFVGGLFGATTNPSVPWFTLGLDDDELEKFQPVKLWLEQATRVVRDSFEPHISPFYTWMPETLADSGLFGNSPMYHRFDPRSGRFIDRALPLGENYAEVDDDGDIIANYRLYSAREDFIIAQYGEDALKAGSQNKKTGKDEHLHRLLHVSLRNPGFTEGRLGPKGFAFTSVVILMETSHAVHVGGTHEFPISWLRLGRIRGEYARGLGQKALSTVKSANIIKRDMLTASNMAVDPMLLTHDEDVKNKLVKKPGNIIVGGISRQGKRLADVLDTSGSFQHALEMSKEERTQIKEKFLFNLFSVLSEGRTGISSEEFLAEEQRRLQLMGPHLTQIQGPFLVPIIERRVSQLQRARRLPPPPPEIENRDIGVVMESAMDRAQKVSAGSSTMRFLQSVGVASQFDPGVADHVNGEAIPAIMQSALGAPATLLRPEVEVAARRQANQAIEAGQQALAAADVSSTINRNEAQANLADAEAQAL